MPVLLQIQGSRKRRPTLLEAARLLDMPVTQLDGSYGVQIIDPWQELYVVRSMADETASNGVAHDDPHIGIFTR
jgi:hypothetical protein